MGWEVPLRMGRIPLLAFALVSFPAPAAETELDAVAVTAMRSPVSKSYRKMLDGMELFERQQARAPGASLRYKLLPRRKDTRMDGISLNVIGDTVALPVRVERDGTFVIERDAKALAEDAAVIPNRRALTMTWRTEIRSPGLPPDTRRLGDLRLECETGMEADLVSTDGGLLSNSLRRRMGYCNDNPARYLYFSERPLFSVTLVSGARSEALPVDELYAGSTRAPLSKAELERCDCQVLLDRTYFLPLGDKSWPDDTQVRFEYMDDPGSVDMPAGLGAPAVVRFDNGYEIRAYRGRPDPALREPNELVVLHDPSGTAVKSRLRAGRERKPQRAP